jgi:hypothetical protein
MRAANLVSLTLPAGAEVRQWWTETLGLDPAEDAADSLQLGDLLLHFGEELTLEVVAFDLVDGPALLTDPAGSIVRIVAPDLAAQEQAEATIRDFATAADDLDGPPVGDLVDQVAAVMSDAHERVGAILGEVGKNKVIATMLMLSQRAREIAPGDDQWMLQAGSSLVSGLIIERTDDA